MTDAFILSTRESLKGGHVGPPVPCPHHAGQAPTWTSGKADLQYRILLSHLL